MKIGGMRKDLLFSLIDQGLLSAFNLILSLVLIRFATPDEFGHFIFFYASAFVLISLQYAMIVTPLNVLLPGRGEAEQIEQTSKLTSVNVLMCVFGVLLAGGLILLHPEDLYVLPSVTAYFVVILVREYGRNLLIVRGEVARALLLDASTVGFSVAGAGVFWTLIGPVAGTIAGTAMGNFAALLVVRPEFHLRPSRFISHLRSYRDIWIETRWALLGAASSEAQVRSYVYLVDAWKGMSALGMVQAGRTLLSPLSLCATAWARIARPRMVAAIYDRRDGDVFRLMMQGILVIAALCLLYGGAILVAWPLIETYIFADKYPDMSLIIILWWAYTSVMSVNYVASAVLQARRQFRNLAFVGGFGAIVAVLGLAAIGQTALPVEYALYVLIAVETIELIGQFYLVGRGRTYRGVEVPA